MSATMANRVLGVVRRGGLRRPLFRWAVIALAMLLISPLLTGCGSTVSSGQKGTESAQPGAAPVQGNAYAGMESIPAIANAATPEEKSRIANLIKAAQKESGLNWYGVQIEPQQGETILAQFKAYYGLPNLKAAYTYAAPGEVVTKVEELLRANRTDVDVVWNSAYSWYLDLQKRGLLLTYDSPEYAAYTISETQGSANRPYWVSDAYAFHPMYNAKLVAKFMGPDWKPKSWKDFTDPRLRGHLSIGDVMSSTSHAATMQGLLKAFGREYFETLQKNVQPVTFTRSAQGRDWVATGEFPVTFSSHAKNAETLLSRGNDGIVLVYPTEGVVLLPFTLAILKNAPNPNASKLFVDFTRSTRGQESILKAGALNFPGRPGVKSPNPELMPPVEQLKLIPMDWNKEGTNEAITQVRDMWKQLGLGH